MFNYCIGKKQYFYLGCISLLLLYIVNIFTNCSVGLIFSLTAIAIGVICLNLNVTTDNCITKIVTNISRYSYTIYLLHILLIRAIYIVTESYFSNIAIGWVPLIVTPLIMIVFYVACTLYDKIKWLPNNLIGIG